MIIVLHGNGLQNIRNSVLSYKKNFDKNVIHEFVKPANLLEVAVFLKTPSLFADKKLVIVDALDDKNSLDEFPDDPLTTIIFCFSKELTKTNLFLKSAITRKAEVRLFYEKDEQSIFPFLDLVCEKNPRAFTQLDSLLDQFGGQYLLTMLFFCLRRFVISPQNLPPFVLKKLSQQKTNFPLSRITELYRLLLETDFRLKRGLIEEKMAFTLVLNRFLTN